MGELGSDQKTVPRAEKHRPDVQTVPAMLSEGVWAEVEVNGEHLRLFSESNAIGIQASVFNVKTKTWLAPSETVDDIEHGKDLATAHAKAYLQRAAGVELPPLQWKESRSR